MENTKIIINTDGGSRGNPGPSAIGVVIEGRGREGKLLWQKKFKEFLGTATNNIAEYKAMILALKEVRKLAGGADIEVRTDSELMYRQIIGQYKVKDANLKLLFNEVEYLKQDLKNIAFRHVPREENSAADALVNETLDSV